MSEKIVAFDVRMLCSDGLERSGLQIIFNGSALTYRDADGNTFQMDRILGMTLTIPPTLFKLLVKRFGS